MKKIVLPAILFAAILASSCEEPQQKERNVIEASASFKQKVEKMTNEKFVNKAYIGNMAEVRMGQRAQKKAESEEVKQFGELMIEDHSAANENLSSVIQEMNIQMPENLPKDLQKKLKTLEEKSGAEFDRAYMDLMVKDHEKDVKFYEKAVSELENPDLKNYARSTLPTLQSHLEKATQIKQNLQQTAVKN